MSSLPALPQLFTTSHGHPRTPQKQPLPPKAATLPRTTEPCRNPSTRSLPRPTSLQSPPAIDEALSSGPDCHHDEEPPSSASTEYIRREPEPGENCDTVQRIVDQQLDSEVRHGFSNARYPDGPPTPFTRLPPSPHGESCGTYFRSTTPRTRLQITSNGSPNSLVVEQPDTPLVWGGWKGTPYTVSYSREGTPYHEGLQFSDPEHCTRQTTPYREGTPCSAGYSREGTPYTEAYSSYDEAYLRSPDPRKPNDFINDWDSIPSTLMLWHPPSRPGVRRSERLREAYAPLVQERRRVDAIYNFFTSPTTFKFLAALFIGISLGFFFHSPPSVALHLSQATAPIHCFANPICSPWQTSRIETSYSLLAHTNRHCASLIVFKNATSALFPSIPQTLSTLANDIRTEAKLQQNLARTLDEATNADSLFTLAHDIAATNRLLQQTQSTLQNTISIATTTLRRFSGYLIYQNPNAFTSVPVAWKRDVPQATSLALQTTIRKNFKGHQSTLRVLCRALDHELLAAQKRVRDALRVLEAGGRFGPLHRHAFFLLRLVTRQLEELRGEELKMMGFALADMPDEGGEEEGYVDASTLRAAFERFYAMLGTLEGKGQQREREAALDGSLEADSRSRDLPIGIADGSLGAVGGDGVVPVVKLPKVDAPKTYEQKTARRTGATTLVPPQLVGEVAQSTEN